jgi:hypothetical protein
MLGLHGPHQDAYIVPPTESIAVVLRPAPTL